MVTDRAAGRADAESQAVLLPGLLSGRGAYLVERTLRGECVRALSKRAKGGVGIGSKLPKLSLPKVRRNPLVEIVPLSTGCLGACTYCKTKHARGTLGSYPLEDIVARVKEAVAEGVTEIWLRWVAWVCRYGAGCAGVCVGTERGVS